MEPKCWQMLPRACAIIPRQCGNPAPEAANTSIGWVCVSRSAVSDSATLCPSPPGSSVRGILQARILEWAAHFLLQGIVPTQGSNLGLLHCRRSLYHLSHQEGKFSTFYKYLFFIFVNKPLINMFFHYICFIGKLLTILDYEGRRRRGWQREDGWMASPAQWHEFEQTPGDSEGQGSLVCCSPWCCKKSDMT